MMFGAPLCVIVATLTSRWCLAQCLVFAARNKGSSMPNSPRKRNAPDSPRGHTSSPKGQLLDDDGGVSIDALGSENDDAGVSRSQSPLSGGSQAGTPPKQPGSRGSGARKGGGSSASHLHRNMLDKALSKKIKRMDARASGSPLTPPSVMHAAGSMHPHAMVQAHAHIQHVQPGPHMLQGPHGAPPGVMGAMPGVWAYTPGAFPPAPPHQVRTSSEGSSPRMSRAKSEDRTVW